MKVLVLGIIACLLCVAAPAAAAAAGNTSTSNPAYALKLTNEGVRISHQMGTLASAGSQSGSLTRICGYYVPTLKAKANRLHVIVRLLYVYAPSWLRPRVTRLSGIVRRVSNNVRRMQSLCLSVGY